MTEMELDMLRARYMHKKARRDFRTCIQLLVVNFVGFVGMLVLYFVNDADALGVALWSLMYLILVVVCAIMTKKSHKVVQHWKKEYDAAIERESGG